jgi:hypothetical protein
VTERFREVEQTVDPAKLLGYLNFSDGRPDPRWQKLVNDAFDLLATYGEPYPWLALHEWLSARLGSLHASGAAAFKDVTQARRVLGLFPRVLAAYRQYHADLLAHQPDAGLFQPFFLVRVFEAILALQGDTDDEEELLRRLLRKLNDFSGYRPVAILETRPQGEPYEHERHRPVPLYLRGVGVAVGPYHTLVSRALAILGETDPALLHDAQLDLNLLDELALDVRAYDHGHPVNRRPNYVFGEWDPHLLDNQGRFRRFVVRQITLDAILARIDQTPAIERAELLEEGASVLAGIMLMATGISGASPAAHDSTQTLAVLMPRIARYRDLFYQQRLQRMQGAHAERLRQEETLTRQPFGGARQHLNGYLARHRALQLQQRYLALLYAEMGYPHASRAEADRVQTASVRMASQILGRISTGQRLLEKGHPAEAVKLLPELEDLLRRGIGCGALADPWNVLGFQGLFPLSPAQEDSVRDLRVEELIQLVEQIFNFHAALVSEAAAAGLNDLVKDATTRLERLAAWWDRFATVEVRDVRRVLGSAAASSATQVGAALLRWHEGGEAPADLAFWRKHLHHFHSPKAFALVLEVLLRKGDYHAALALLINWVGHAEQAPLEEGNYSFHTLAMRWMLGVTGGREPAQAAELIRKFFDYLEANAEDYWEVPRLEAETFDAGGEEVEPDRFAAAYDDVTYQDSTDDGEEGAVAEGGPPSREESDLETDSDQLFRRLPFLSTLARLWQIAARLVTQGAPQETEALEAWLSAAERKRQQLLALLDTLHAHALPAPSGSYDSLVDYDRQRVLKEQLLYTTIATSLDMTLAAGTLHGACVAAGRPVTPRPGQAAWESQAIGLEQALFHGDPATARAALEKFVEAFRSQSLLFTTLADGGEPRQVLQVRIAQTVLRALLANLPRLGLLRETFELLRTARNMEHAATAQSRGVTEFNHFFQSAFQAVVESIVEAAVAHPPPAAPDDPASLADVRIVQLLEKLTKPFVALWIDHSKTLQLSTLESVLSEGDWRGVQAFIQRYGNELFHARFMTLANLRGILHRGTARYLDYLQEESDPRLPGRLVQDLARPPSASGISRDEAARRLSFILQAIIENYEEYKDYNTTTTQSDYGENLHVLLDFLRVKAGYDRHAWHFRPLVLAHEVLARKGRDTAALLWEQSLTRLTRDLSQQHLDQLTQLERARGVRLNTVRDRVEERFVKPLALDRLCALVEPAVREARQGSGATFARLQQEVQSYTATPTGVGLDVPAWLRRLELEVHRVQAAQSTLATLAETLYRIPRRPVAFEELQRQLEEWETLSR